MKCEHCGAPMRQGDTACAYCGAVFETSQPMVVNIYNQEKQAEKEAGIRGEVTDIAWGHQIRSYVLQPYTMVKDLRTGEERAQASAVLDGDLDPFINAYLKWTALKKKEHAK